MADQRRLISEKGGNSSLQAAPILIHTGFPNVQWLKMKKTQAKIPRRVMLEPKWQQYIMYVVYVYALECANLRSFLGSPHQCDPGASLSENIEDQGIQEAKLASSKLGQLSPCSYCYLLL